MGQKGSNSDRRLGREKSLVERELGVLNFPHPASYTHSLLVPASVSQNIILFPILSPCSPLGKHQGTIVEKVNQDCNPHKKECSCKMRNGKTTINHAIS